MCRHSKNHQLNYECKPIFNVYTTHLKMFQLQIWIQSSLWSGRVYLDDTEANYKQMGHVLCIKFLTHCFQSNGVSSVNTFLMFSGRTKHPAASVFSHLGYVLIQPFNYACVCLPPHTETHVIHWEHIRGRGNGTSTHRRKGEGEGELRTWLSSSSTLYIRHQGVLVIAKVPTGVLWITLILCLSCGGDWKHFPARGKLFS